MPTVKQTSTRSKSTEQTSIAEGIVQNQLDRITDTYRVTGVTSMAGALTASGIPEKGDAHPTDTQLICRRLSVDGIAPRVFEVRAEYEFIGYPTATVVGGLPQPGVTWSSQLIEEPSFYDANDQPILLPSGEALDTPPSKSWTLQTLQYEFSSLTFNANVAFTHGGRVNGSSWTTVTTGSVPAKCAMLRAVAATKVYGTDFNYFRVSYDFAFRSQEVGGQQRGWQLCLLNAGFDYKNAAGNRVSIIGPNGDRPTVPTLLNAAGTQHALMPGVTITPNFKYVDLYKTADFTLLGVI